MDTETKQMFELILNKLEIIDRGQGETYQLIKALEENAKVTRAEQDKMAYNIADIQGKINRIVGEVEEHDNVIRQIRAIK